MKKALKVTAIAFLAVSMIIPTKIAMSSSNKPNTSDKNLIADQNNGSGIYIKTSLDGKIDPNPGNSDYPTMAIISDKIQIQIESPIIPLLYSNLFEVQIEGDNDHKESTTPLEIKDSEKIQGIYYKCEWKPAQVGIFNIVSYYNNKVIAKRKVYVNDKDNNGYMQLKDLKASADGTNSTITATIKGQPSTYKSNPGQITYTIGEPLVWSRTLLPTALGTESPEGDYSIDEKTNGFNFNNGIYNISAYVQGKNSIEYEDAKAISYEESGLAGLKLELKRDNNYKYTASVTVADDENIKGNLQYEFLLWDYKGWTILKDYSASNTYTLGYLGYATLAPGKYRIYARVKQLLDPYNPNNPIGNLPNSYEAETFQDLVKQLPCNTNIKDINIWAYEAKGNNNNNPTDYTKYKCIKKGDTYQAVSHEMNVIQVNATQSSNLVYKAYAVHDGICYPLCNYSDSKYITFYPKSSGAYTLIIFAKEPVPGFGDDSENPAIQFDKEEYTVNVTDINNACDGSN